MYDIYDDGEAEAQAQSEREAQAKAETVPEQDEAETREWVEKQATEDEKVS